MKTDLKAEVVLVPDLSVGQRAEMLNLLQRYFHGVKPSAFESDLVEKEWAVLLTEPQTGGIIGFTTCCVLQDCVQDVAVRAIFSGDTIIDRQYWGSLVLERTWVQQVFKLIDQEPDYRWFWFLICKGYRTYRYLSVYFKHYYPSPEPMPIFEKTVLDQLAGQKYSTHYNAEAGVIRTPSDYRLNQGVGDISERELADPRIRFFHEQNPGWIDGAELACLAELNRDNFNRMALRMLESGNDR